MHGITVSYRTEFEACYVQNSELHAHRYRIEVTVDGPQRYEDTGRVIEFSVLAKYLKSVLPDKKYLYTSTSTFADRDAAYAMERCGVDTFDMRSEISVEGMCIRIKDDLQYLLDMREPGVRVLEVKLRETAESFATWSLLN